jgi:hypothetical protein
VTSFLALLQASLLTLVLTVALPLLPAPPAWAAAAAAASADVQHYVCAGEPLQASVYRGAVDAPAIPNSNGGTVPGGFIVLEWRGVRLQLPRTNNAGVPSYTDGRWWWQAADPAQPTFAERRGGVTTIPCERAG